MREDPYIPPPSALTLTATTDNSSVKLIKEGTLSNTYEVDTGNGWQSYTFGTVINLNNGQSCKWRCSAHPTTQGVSNYVQFEMTGTIEASGNCNSMLSSDYKNITSLSGYDYAFFRLFISCKPLSRAPELPATTLSDCCYSNMFMLCDGLTKAPELPATTLTGSCYSYMFSYCRSLTKAPELPATTLTEDCYTHMFKTCDSLTKAPLLPATTLAEDCYSGMFDSCKSLREVRIAATDISAKNCIGAWMQNVPNTGDFYCDPNTTFPSGTSGIPLGWTRLPLSDYPTT